MTAFDTQKPRDMTYLLDPPRPQVAEALARPPAPAAPATPAPEEQPLNLMDLLKNIINALTTPAAQPQPQQAQPQQPQAATPAPPAPPAPVKAPSFPVIFQANKPLHTLPPAELADGLKAWSERYTTTPGALTQRLREGKEGVNIRDSLRVMQFMSSGEGAKYMNDLHEKAKTDPKAMEQYRQLHSALSETNQKLQEGIAGWKMQQSRHPLVQAQRRLGQNFDTLYPAPPAAERSVDTTTRTMEAVSGAVAASGLPGMVQFGADAAETFGGMIAPDSLKQLRGLSANVQSAIQGLGIKVAAVGVRPEAHNGIVQAPVTSAPAPQPAPTVSR